MGICKSTIGNYEHEWINIIRATFTLYIETLEINV
jgi:hypothetical protein